MYCTQTVVYTPKRSQLHTHTDRHTQQTRFVIFWRGVFSCEDIRITHVSKPCHGVFLPGTGSRVNKHSTSPCSPYITIFVCQVCFLNILFISRCWLSSSQLQSSSGLSRYERWVYYKLKGEKIKLILNCSVPDPMFCGPPGSASGSVIYLYGSGSFHQQAKNFYFYCFVTSL